MQERLDLIIRLKPILIERTLALLFPEVAFPDKAMDYLGGLDPRTLSFFLDKFDNSIMHKESLWRSVLANAVDKTVVDLTTALLDRGGRVKITAALVNCLEHLRCAGEVFSILLEYCDVEVSEDLLISLCAFEDSAQIVRTFKSRGVVGDSFDSFTSQQLLLALKRANTETAAFFLQHQAANTAADEMLKSGMKNERYAKEVTLLLLGHLDPDCMDEQVIITALKHDHHGGDLIRLLHNCRNSLPFSEAALKVAVRRHENDVVELVLEGLKGVRVTEQILTAAAAIQQYAGFWFTGRQDRTIQLLFHHDPDIRIQESTVGAAVRNDIEGLAILKTLCEHEKSLLCTEFMVSCAATVEQGPDALDIILEHECHAKISRSMIMVALGAARGAALISVMLRHDRTIVIDEEHLIAAASNRFDSSTIFAFLQTKGKLGNTNSASDIINSGPAKRRRVSPRSLPCITRKVIDAAFSNNEDDENLPLLELFLECGLITQAELDNRS